MNATDVLNCTFRFPLCSKNEEIETPSLGDFVEYTKIYTKKQFLQMERLILQTLEFDLNTPTVHTFICHIGVSALDPSVVSLAQVRDNAACPRMTEHPPFP